MSEDPAKPIPESIPEPTPEPTAEPVLRVVTDIETPTAATEVVQPPPEIVDTAAGVQAATNDSPQPTADPDGLGLPGDIVPRSITVPLGADNAARYTPGECAVRLDTQAQIGLRRLHAGLATIERRDLDHSTVICWLLGRLAE